MKLDAEICLIDACFYLNDVNYRLVIMVAQRSQCKRLLDSTNTHTQKECHVG